ncbi:MAG: hypothetical protein ABSC22_14550 [Roseiarcus sp.]|jgi:hypothetical protein
MNWDFDRFGWIKNLEFTAIAAIAIAIACVMVGQGAERYAADASPSQVALSDPPAAPIFNTIDYATTGSIKGQSVVVTPCGSQKVEH